MPSRSDLQVRVLDLLGVIEAGQNPSPEDVEKVDSFISSAVVWLQDDRVAVINPANISSGTFEALATVVADSAGPAFGQGRDPDTLATNKHALRIAQAAENGAFSRRRMEFTAPQQRQLQATQGFAGTAARAPAAASGFAGTEKAPLAAVQAGAGTQGRELAAVAAFAGAKERPLTASAGAAGTVQRPLEGAK